jgi:hypothetical protein
MCRSLLFVLDAIHRQSKVSAMTTKPISLLRSFAFISLTTLRVFAGNALENYVQQSDKSFEWKVAEQKNLGPMNITHATLTSQTWRTNVWTHHLQIVRPGKSAPPGDSAFSSSPATVPARATLTC